MQNAWVEVDYTIGWLARAILTRYRSLIIYVFLSALLFIRLLCKSLLIAVLRRNWYSWDALIIAEHQQLLSIKETNSEASKPFALYQESFRVDETTVNISPFSSSILTELWALLIRNENYWILFHFLCYKLLIDFIFSLLIPGKRKLTRWLKTLQFDRRNWGWWDLIRKWKLQLLARFERETQLSEERDHRATYFSSSEEDWRKISLHTKNENINSWGFSPAIHIRCSLSLFENSSRFWSDNENSSVASDINKMSLRSINDWWISWCFNIFLNLFPSNSFYFNFL